MKTTYVNETVCERNNVSSTTADNLSYSTSLEINQSSFKSDDSQDYEEEISDRLNGTLSFESCVVHTVPQIVFKDLRLNSTYVTVIRNRFN